MIDLSDVAPPEFCPIVGCWSRLIYFTGHETLPDGLYCPLCRDMLYDFDGNEVAHIGNNPNEM